MSDDDYEYEYSDDEGEYEYSDDEEDNDDEMDWNPPSTSGIAFENPNAAPTLFGKHHLSNLRIYLHCSYLQYFPVWSLHNRGA